MHVEDGQHILGGAIQHDLSCYHCSLFCVVPSFSMNGVMRFVYSKNYIVRYH